MTNVAVSSTRHGLDTAKVSWRWLLALGILMTLLGVIGLGMGSLLTFVSVLWFGVLVIIAGVSQVLDAFHHKGWKGMAWHLLIGLVYILAGIALVTTPVAAAFWLTLILAIALVVTGAIRVVMAFQIRQRGSVWLWVLLSGLVSIVLGVLIYGLVATPPPEALVTPEAQLAWVNSWGWVIGLFVAVELIMEGIALISIALASKAATH